MASRPYSAFAYLLSFSRTPSAPRAITVKAYMQHSSFIDACQQMLANNLLRLLIAAHFNDRQGHEIVEVAVDGGAVECDLDQVVSLCYSWLVLVLDTAVLHRKALW